MPKADAKKGSSDPASSVATKDELQEIRKELKSESERLKALEVRVGAIEQNLLGN